MTDINIKILQYDLPQEKEFVHIYPLSDWHLGSAQFDKRKLKEITETIKDDPNGVVLIAGDVLENATRHSVSDIWSQNMTPQEQVEMARDYLWPIREKIVAVTEGNHELRTYKADGFLPLRYLTEILHLDVDRVYSMGPFVLFLGFGDVDRHKGKSSPCVFTVYCKHGDGGGRKMGAKALRMADMGIDVCADVYIMGHVHQQMMFPGLRYEPDVRTRTAVPRPMLFVDSGSFLGWGGYAAQKGYPPTVTGCPIITLWYERSRGERDLIVRRMKGEIII